MTTKHDSEGAELSLLSIVRKYATEDAAREYLEAIRWPDGPACVHCGLLGNIYKVTANAKAKIRAGLYKCGGCRRTFTVKVGTVMEDSHIPCRTWLLAFYVMCASKTQVSALQLQRQLEIGSYRSAWFMCHRIRFALKDPNPMDKLVGTVEADETYIGGRRRGYGRGYTKNKTPVVSLVERGGRVRSEVVPGMVTGKSITRLLRKHVADDVVLNTDSSPLYTTPGRRFASHDVVDHGIEEYARWDRKTGRLASTNVVEGFFGNSKRSIDGTHHHISGQHAALYFSELDHKYNTRKVTDGERTIQGIRMMEGKRLMLHRSKEKKAE